MKKLFLSTACGIFLATTLAAGAQVVIRVEPPHHAIEVVPPPEHEGWVWQPGYQHWDGAHYVWTPGHYAEPPYSHAHWVEGHWSHRDGGYVWVEGHWSR